MQKAFSFGDLVQCASAAAERVCFDTEVLKHRDIEVAQRFVVIAPEGEVLTVLEKASTISVTMRVESDSSASRAIDSIRSNFSKNNFWSRMSSGGC